MSIEERGQNDNLALQRERGIDANKSLVNEIVEAISSKWEVPAESPKQPVILLMGGFQGSGKTSVIDALSSKMPLIAISSDEIRHNLFQKIPFSAVFVHTVNAARNHLIDKALETRQHVAVDLFCTPIRLELFRSFAKDTSYNILTVYLEASRDTLIKRMERPAQAGKYKGTLEELQADFDAYGELGLNIYDAVFNSEQQSPEEISEALLQMVKDLQ